MTTQQAINNAHGTRVIVMTVEAIDAWAFSGSYMAGIDDGFIDKSEPTKDLTRLHVAQEFLQSFNIVTAYEKFITDHNLQFIGLPESQLQDLFKKFTKN